MTDSNSFKALMKRCAGSWSSQRRYLYPKKDLVKNLSSELSVEFVDKGGPDFQANLAWKTRPLDSSEIVSEGEMLTESREGKLHRNVGYMTEDETVCEVHMVDPDCVVFTTEYCGMAFREEIRLIGEDIRLRQTLGTKEGETFLVGQYYETRITNS
jgi:hypothetical protein